MGYAISDLAFGSRPDYAHQAATQEAARQQAITQGTQQVNQAFAGFDPSFYQQRAQAYNQYAIPQLAQQYQQNRNQVGFGLGNRGLLNSSAAQQQWSNLNQNMGQAKQSIADTGINQAQQLQQQIENARNALLGQVYQGADPSAAGAQAISTAASFQQPSTFAPVANMFANLANQYYLSQLINSQRQATSLPLAGGSDYGVNVGALPKS